MFTLEPSWRVHATKPVPPGASVLARPEVAILSVSDADLEVVLRVLKRNGYDKIVAEREAFPTVGAFVHAQEASP